MRGKCQYRLSCWHCLGIPTFTDKLVQEVLRMILESIYEPIFLKNSHGFRVGKSCHTALKYLKNNFIGARWFIEGDIKGCFDNIDHSKLIEILNSKETLNKSTVEKANR